MLGPKTIRFSKYGIVGLVNNLGLYLLFLGLIHLKVSPVLASGVSYVIGVLVSYLLNRQWTYQSTSSHAQDLPKFLVAYGVGLVAALLLISVLIIWIPPAFAQIINMIVVALVIYTMLNVLNFGGGERDRVD